MYLLIVPEVEKHKSNFTMARAFLIMEALEEEQRMRRIITAQRRRQLRNEVNVDHLSDSQFSAHYRVTKSIFAALCRELSPFLKPAQRSTRISLECEILTALSFYASGSYQKPVGMSYFHGLSQPSVSNAVRNVTAALNQPALLFKYIRFPQTHRERQTIINGFYNKFKFPGCMGCVDGTHVALIRPTDHEERFFNRKHYHSRNVQIICDSDLNILNVDATFGGASHDSFIWRSSEVSQHMQELYFSGERLWLLGDSGYPLRPWLLTPIINAVPGSPEEKYTEIHCSARNTVERCIGVLKARWRCLLAHRVLHYDHHMVAKIINACTILHNICNKHRLPVPELPREVANLDQIHQIHAPAGEAAVLNDNDLLLRGRQQQSQIVHRLWVE